MEVISFLQGVTRVEVAWDEIRPKDGFPVAVTMQFLQNAYGFQEAGFSDPALAGLQSPVFRRGIFEIEGKPVPISQAEVLVDSFVVTSSITDYADAIIEDAFHRLQAELSYRKPSSLAKKTYQSTIISDLGFDLHKTMETWKSIMIKMSELQNVKSSYEPASLRFMNFDSTATDNQVIFERRYQAPEGKYWFFSVAPLSTSSHIELLNHLCKTFRDL